MSGKSTAIFSENLKVLRKENALSQLVLAQRIGVTQQCVSLWERGKIEPTLTQLWKLADIFDIPIDVMIGRKEF